MMNRNLPRPEGWRPRYLTMGLLFAFAVAGGGYFTVKTVLAIAHTHWLASVVTATAAIAFLLGAVFVATSLGWLGRLHAEFDNSGTTLRTAAAARWLSLWFTALTVSIVLYLLFAAQMRDDLPDIRVRSSVWMGIALFASVWGLIALFRGRKRERPRLRISADGIDSHDAASDFTIQWADITDITGVAPGQKGLRPIAFQQREGAQSVIPNAGAYAQGGNALFWLVRHYWLHPENRIELSNGVAIQRLRTRSFQAE